MILVNHDFKTALVREITKGHVPLDFANSQSFLQDVNPQAWAPHERCLCTGRQVTEQPAPERSSAVKQEAGLSSWSQTPGSSHLKHRIE